MFQSQSQWPKADQYPIYHTTLITPTPLFLTVELSNLERACRSLRCNTLVRQSSLTRGTSSTDTVHTNILNTITQEHRVSTTRSLDVKVLELDVLTDSILASRASQSGNSVTVLAGAVAGEVVEENVGDVHARGVLGAGSSVDVEVARVDEGGVLVVAAPEVAEGHVVDEAVADVRAGPGLETGAVLAVEHPDVLDDDILDEGHLALVLAKRTDRLTVGA